MGTEMDVSEKREFFLQSVDPPSGLAVAEIYCGTYSIAMVAEQIGEDIQDFNPRNIHILGELALSKAERFFSVKFDVGENNACLCSWSLSDGLPYRLHAGRELILMRSGSKPLTVLSGGIPPDENFEEIPEYLFDPLVESGLLVKSEFCQPNPSPHPQYKGMRHVLYALKSEAWRLDAYKMLRNIARKTGWNEALTRFEGSLLGYSEQENDAYAASLQKHARQVVE